MSYVALLRGINLGKLNKVDMKSLKELFTELGYKDVHTYIQTGNVFFSNTTYDLPALEQALLKKYGFTIPVVIRTKEELQEISMNPIFEMDPVYVMMLKEEINEAQREMLLNTVDEKFAVVANKNIVIHYQKSYHQTKFTNNYFEKKLGMPSTALNTNTVRKLISKM